MGINGLLVVMNNTLIYIPYNEINSDVQREWAKTEYNQNTNSENTTLCGGLFETTQFQLTSRFQTLSMQ